MHKIIRYVLLSALLLGATFSVNAHNYDKEWNKVDSLISRYDQKKAIDAVRQIIDMAQSDGNSHEILRCALMINRLDAPNRSKSGYKVESYLLFDSLATVMDDDGLKAICHYLQAFCLDEYARANNFRIPADNRLDMDIDQLRDKLFFHFEQAFKLAGRKHTKDYTAFIPDCNESYIKVRPALKDVLLESACINLGADDWGNNHLYKDDDHLFGTSKQYVQGTRHAEIGKIDDWQLYVLRLLTERNLNANADIRASIDLKRLTTIYECLSAQDWISVSEKIEKLARSYRDKSIYSAGIYALSAKVLIEHVINDTSIDKGLRSRLSVHAYELLETAIGIWPDSQTEHDCRELLAQIERESVSISFDRTQRADMPNLAVLRFSNTDSVWFKAVKYDPDKHLIRSYDLYDNKFMEEFRDAPDLQEEVRWSVATDNHGDHIEHAMWISLPALRKGDYIIYASADKDFADDVCYSCRLLTSSRLMYAPTYLTDNDTLCSLTGYIYDAATGNAASGCSYTFTCYDEDDNAYILNGRTEADGFLSLYYPRRSDFDFIFCIDYEGVTDTLLFEPRNVNHYSRHEYSKGPVHVKINTDRAIYRPGDTVRYCGIVSETPADMDGHVKAGIPVAVFVSGRDDFLIQETVSDAHGLFEGIWPVPADYRPGWIELNAITYPKGQDPDSLINVLIDADDRYLRLPGYTCEIEIESYSRNLLELKFDKMLTPPVQGAEAECTGTVLTPLGNPVGGARIQWETSISSKDEQSFTTTYRDLILETGETETLPDGTFRILFKADAQGSDDIKIKLRVTDRNGETHEYRNYYSMSARTNLEIGADNIIDSPDNVFLTVRSYNNYPDSGQYRIKVEALKPHWGEGMEIYNTFDIKEYERAEMSENALSQGTLSTMFPAYEFGLPSEPQVSCTILDSLFAFHTNDTTQIRVPGIKTGRYRITVTSDDAFISNLAGKSFYGERGNAGCRTQDLFVSVGNADDTLSTNGLIYLDSRQIILQEGDTAKVRIGSPYPGTVIRYDIINRNGSLVHGTMVSDGLLHTLSLPVDEDLCGSILVVATAFKDGIKAKSFTAQYIPYYTKHLNYELTTFRSNLTSGSEEIWTFRFTDKTGNPVRASVLVDMYDSVLDKLRYNSWVFYPWQYMTFSQQEPIRIEQVYKNVTPAIKATIYNGLRTIGLGIANPLLSPFDEHKLPIPVREMSSSVYVINDIPSLNDNNSLIASSDKLSQISEQSIRKNLSHTGLFLTNPQTDENGVVTIKFRAPELLTRWNLQVIAYTDDLLTTGFRGYVTTSRSLMIEPAAIRFFRQGDVTDFAQKITNTHTDDLEVTVLLRFKDAESGKQLDLTAGDSIRTITVKAGGSVTIPFRLTIPDGVHSLTYTAIATAQGFSDGQQETIPVLSNRVQVTRSMSLFNNGNETRTFRSDAPQTSASGKVFDETLTLQYHSQPIWYALDALPALTEINTPDNLSLAYAFAAQVMTYMITDLYPAAKGRLKKEQFDLNLMKQNIEQYDELITDRQNKDGGWSWMPGGESSVYVTSLILYVYEFMEATMDYSYDEGLRFLASRIPENISRPSHSDIMFLYLFSAQQKLQKGYSTSVKETFDRLLAEAEKYNYNHENLYYRGLLVQLFMNIGKPDIANNLAKKLLQESKYSDEMGRWWDENRGGYLWHEAPIETQAMLIRALKTAGYEREAGEAARWLLKQKETTAWESTPATAAAIMALLETASGSLPDNRSAVTVTVGNDRIESGTDGNEDGYMSRTWNGPVTPDKSVLTVSSTHEGISWGALYHTFTQDLDDVEDSGNGMQLKRTLWRVVSDTRGERLEEITPTTILHKGERIKVRLELTLDRTFECLELKSERAASLEPVSTDAGYTYNLTHDILYYRAPTNTSDNLYIDRLEPGTYTIEYDLYAQKAGTYSMGLATVRCFYAPAYRAITPNTIIKVE